MVSEELLINIVAKLQGGGFEDAIANLKNLQTQTGNIDGLAPNINPTVVGDAIDEIENIRKKTDNFDGLSPYINPTVVGNALEDLEHIEKVANFDGLAPHINPNVIGDALEKLEEIQNKADNLEGQAPVIKPTVDDSEAVSALQNIQNKIDNLGGIESAIGGAVGAFGLEQMLGGGLETAQGLDKAWRSWVGKIQHSGASLKDAKTQADNLSKSVNKFASQGQSNDQFFKNIAGTVINANTNVSDSMLGMTERVISGYELMRGASGDTLYEMEKELQQYLTTGATERLTELESLGGGKWMLLLKEADTVEERIKVLNDMLTEEGVMGALNVDAPTKSLDQLKATFEASFTDIGTTLLNIAKPIADFFLGLDNATGGVSTTVMVVVGVIGLLAMAFVGLLGIAAPAFPVLMSIGGALGGLTGLFAANTTAISLNTAGMSSNLAAAYAHTSGLIGNTSAQNASLMTRIRSIPTWITETAGKVANTIATHANTLAVKLGGTAAVTTTGANLGLASSFRALTIAMLTNPMFWIAAVIMGVAAAVIYLKTQTTLLSGTMEKAASSMNTLNNRLELLQGAKTALSKQTDELKAKLDTLDKTSAEYETTYKNYQENMDKLSNVKREIQDINAIKGSIDVAIDKAKVNTTKTQGELEKMYSGTDVDPLKYASKESIANLQKAAGEMLYYNDLSSRAYDTQSKLSDAQKKTWQGKQFTEFSQKLGRINDLELKALELAKDGKELDWGEQIELGSLKTDTDKLAGVLPTDSIEERVKKYKEYAKDANAVEFVPVEEALRQWLEGVGPYLEGAWKNTEKWFSNGAEWIQKGWNDFSKWFTDGANSIGSDISNAWDSVTNWVKSKAQGLADWLSGLPEWLKQKAGDMWGWLKDTTKDIPIVNDLLKGVEEFYNAFESNDRDLGATIKQMIDSVDWNALGNDIGNALLEAIKGTLKSLDIFGLFTGDGSGGSLSLPEFKMPDFGSMLGGFSLPSLDWNSLISPWGVESWSGKISNWTDWGGKIANWSGWSGKISNWSAWAGKISNWSDWKSKILNWSDWKSKISQWSEWGSKITPVNLANFVSGVILGGGAGDDGPDPYFGKGNLYEGNKNSTSTTVSSTVRKSSTKVDNSKTTEIKIGDIKITQTDPDPDDIVYAVKKSMAEEFAAQG